MSKRAYVICSLKVLSCRLIGVQGSCKCCHLVAIGWVDAPQQQQQQQERPLYQYMMLCLDIILTFCTPDARVLVTIGSICFFFTFVVPAGTAQVLVD
jgi:hypothetical protein